MPTKKHSTLSRRTFLRASAATAATAVVSPLIGGRAIAGASPIELPPLPYETNALDPYISSRTLDFHYGKHHRGYVRKTNQRIVGTALEGATLEDIIRKTAGDATKSDLFNVAAQAWNHTFYWRSLKPRGGGVPPRNLEAAIASSFGDMEAFKSAFVSAAATLFGSGWTWLIADTSGLAILKTSNADTPIAHGKTPLLVVDVWEHAYYLDYQNRRKAYLEVVLDKLVNWDFAAQNLEKTR